MKEPRKSTKVLIEERYSPTQMLSLDKSYTDNHALCWYIRNQGKYTFVLPVVAVQNHDFVIRIERIGVQRPRVRLRQRPSPGDQTRSLSPKAIHNQYTEVLGKFLSQRLLFVSAFLFNNYRYSSLVWKNTLLYTDRKMRIVTKESCPKLLIISNNGPKNTGLMHPLTTFHSLSVNYYSFYDLLSFAIRPLQSSRSCLFFFSLG